MRKKFCLGMFSIIIGLFLTLFGDIQTVCAQDEFTLEEITVTAQKREENQQKVPIAMEVLSGDDFKEQGKSDLDDILSTISGVMMQSAEDGLRVSIRGMSNDNSPFQNVNISTPTVAVNTDGAYTTRNTGNQNLFDIERVEVLFGPQSTMYASTSPGGIVNVITSKPNTDKFEGSGVLGYGDYNYLHTEGVMNAPLSDTMAIRAAFSTSQHDGYLSNGSDDEDIKSARLKGLFQPNDKFSIVLTGELNKSGGQGFAGVEAFINQDDVDDPWTSDSANAGLGIMKNQKKITAAMDWDLGVGTLTVTPLYSREKGYSSGSEEQTMGVAEGEAAPVYLNTTTRKAVEKGFEARIASSADSPFNWILGGNIHNSREDQTAIGVAQTEGSDDTYATRYNLQKTRAVFGNITYPLTDRFRATGGVRISSDSNLTYNYELSGTTVRADQSLEIEYSSPDYKVGIEYDLSDNSMIYTDWTTSYRVTGMASQMKEIHPELLTAYSAGLKNRFFDNKFQLNLSAYYYDYENYLANASPMETIVDENGNGQWDPDETNTDFDLGTYQQGDARIYGFDIQTSTIISSKDQLDFSVSYVKKYFTDLFFDYEELTNSLGIDDVDYSDKDMPQAPNWNAKLAYDHNFLFGNGGSLIFRLEATYTSKYCLNWIAKTPSLTIDLDTMTYSASVEDTSDVRWQDPYYLGDITFIYTDPSGNLSVSGYVRNIQNYAVKRFLDGMGNLYLGEPRTYGAVLTVRY